MKTVVQRVDGASVVVEGDVIADIGRGLLVLAGFSPRDTDESLRWMARKLVGLRIFADAEGRMNSDLTDVGGSLLVVSQFTLYGEVARGRRPSFTAAAPPDLARDLYGRFLACCRELGVPVAAGRFGAMMDVRLVNSGPVTLILER